MSIKVKFGKQVLRVIAANYTLRALFVFSNWIKRLVKWNVSAQAGSRACSPSFWKRSAAQTCWEIMFLFVPHASQVSQRHKEWLPLESCQSLADLITSGTLKRTWSNRRWSILIPLLLETRNCKESLPADRWLHKSRPSAANYGRAKIHTAEFSVYLLKISKGVTAFPDHKAIHSITSIEPVNYLNNLKPGVTGAFNRSRAGWGLVWWSLMAEGGNLFSQLRVWTQRVLSFLLTILSKGNSERGRIWQN